MDLKQLKNRLVERLIDVYYRILIGRWNRVENPKEAYTVILPVIPEFYAVTEYNLRFLANCDLTHCDEVIVMADSRRRYAENKAVVDGYADRLNVRYEVLPWFRRLMLRTHWVSHVIYTSSFVTAIKLSRAKYCYLHDGDFFFTDRNHLERLFAEAQRDALKLLATYSRPYEGYPHWREQVDFPATFEVLMRRDFITSRPPYQLYAGNVDGLWHSTFTRFYLSVMDEHCRLLDTPGGDPRRLDAYADRLSETDRLPVGIHFKHLFNRIRAFEEQGRAFDDSKYAIFLLHVVTAANYCCRHKLFESMDEYFDSLKVSRSNYFPVFQRYFLEFAQHELLTADEQRFLADCFERLKARTSDVSPADLPASGSASRH